MSQLVRRTENQIEERREFLKSLVGKEVTTVVTGLSVKGTVEDFKEDQYSFVLVIRHEPVNWGGSIFTVNHSSERKEDGFGNLSLTELVEPSNIDL